MYSTAGEVIALLNDYLFSELPLDIENVHKGATNLSFLKRTLSTACQGLNRLATSSLSARHTLLWIYTPYIDASLFRVTQILWTDLFYSEIDLTLSSLETLAKVFDHPSCSLTHTKSQVQFNRCSLGSTAQDKALSQRSPKLNALCHFGSRVQTWI